MPKKVFIKNFGCQMNVRDSEFVMGVLLENDFKKAVSINDADVILFNSCSVREHAEDRLFSNIADLGRLKKKNPDLVIGLIGCTAQNHKEGVLKKVPAIDFVCGPGNETDIPEILKDILENRCSIIATDKVNKKRPELFPKYRNVGFKALVSIGEGCDNFCSYCIVPYVRGRERSRDAKDIIREVKDLAGRGFKEITLLGQNVNSYKARKGKDFVRLLQEINGLKGIERIRFMTSHPKDASVELFKVMRDLDKVCEHLHLPIQSGSTRVLRLMNRGYSHDKYLKLADCYKKLLPEGTITTDIIVGFPSEKEKDFKKTYRLMKEVEFDSAFMFKYSPRPPAKSIKLKDDVPGEVKQGRLEALLGLQCKISQKRNEAMEGKVLEVLVDGYDEKSPYKFTGRTRTNKIVVSRGDEGLIGKFVSVNIVSSTPHALIGEIVDDKK